MGADSIDPSKPYRQAMDELPVVPDALYAAFQQAPGGATAHAPADAVVAAFHDHDAEILPARVSAASGQVRALAWDKDAQRRLIDRLVLECKRA